ncbi:hypothetical protein PtA15_15A26 [Puccinia triticina]|uniref:Uncharacterized protein n=1 Tax=Puccinia triticina TaxID=208348 RepID=A0ABY7D5T4_9BASI|nr:uncharacterized protein PtA15_15A26 [Puccinia triticina]WAQ91637.1 hypothetical protein PtA15_15A26 [Puccinia triticina]
MPTSLSYHPQTIHQTRHHHRPPKAREPCCIDHVASQPTADDSRLGISHQTI